MTIEFYDVKNRQKVSVDESRVKKVTYHPKGTGSARYGLRTEYEGRSLTKFISKAEYERLNVPEV